MGGVAGLAVIAIGIWFFFRQRRMSQKTETQALERHDSFPVPRYQSPSEYYQAQGQFEKYHHGPPQIPVPMNQIYEMPIQSNSPLELPDQQFSHELEWNPRVNENQQGGQRA